MTQSGITIGDDVPISFKDIKESQKYWYICFKITDDKKKIVTAETLSREDAGAEKGAEQAWDELVKTLKDDEPRYIVFDIHHHHETENRKIQKLLFISWCSDNCKIGKKMIYSSSKSSLLKTLVGVKQPGLMASDFSDLSFADALKQI